jgi:hypothetical protein
LLRYFSSEHDTQAKGQEPRAKSFSLPGTFRNPGYFTLKRQTAEAQTAEAKLAQKSARPSTDRAAVAMLGGKLRFLIRLGDLCCCCHFFLLCLAYGHPLLALSLWPLALLHFKLDLQSFLLSSFVREELFALLRLRSAKSQWLIAKSCLTA